MSDAYSWLYLDHDGGEVHDAPALVTTAFPSQADAEAWLGESWESLAEAGVAAVTLLCEAEVVYGPMSLAAET